MRNIYVYYVPAIGVVGAVNKDMEETVEEIFDVRGDLVGTSEDGIDVL